MLKKLLRNRMVVAGSIIVFLLIFLAIFGSMLPIRDPYETNPAARLREPCAEYVLGGDQLGRDVLSRLIYGTRISIGISALAITAAALIGSLCGIIAGYYEGVLGNIIMRLMDVLFSFPTIFLGLAIIAILGSGALNLAIAISIVYIPRFARVVRAPTLEVKNNEYIEAERLLGAGPLRILRRHILPNIMAPLIVQITLSLSTAILVESSLSFLGVGVQLPAASWGAMLNEGRKMAELRPTLAIFPGAAIMLAVFGFNILGDGLRDVLDPRLI